MRYLVYNSSYSITEQAATFTSGGFAVSSTLKEIEVSDPEKLLDVAKFGDELIFDRVSSISDIDFQAVERIYQLTKLGVTVVILDGNRRFIPEMSSAIGMICDVMREFRENYRNESSKAGKLGGRPKKLTEDKREIARDLWLNSEMTKKEVSEATGYSQSSLYRLFGRR